MPMRARASFEQHVGRALGDQHAFIAVLVVHLDRGHHLALGRERDLADTLETLRAPLVHAELAFGDQEGRFRRVALDLPVTVGRPPQLHVAGQAAAAQHEDRLGAMRLVFQRRAVDLEIAGYMQDAVESVHRRRRRAT